MLRVSAWCASNARIDEGRAERLHSGTLHVDAECRTTSSAQIADRSRSWPHANNDPRLEACRHIFVGG